MKVVDGGAAAGSGLLRLFRVEALDLRLQPAVLVAKVPIGLLKLFEALSRATRGRERDERKEQRHRCEKDWPDHDGPACGGPIKYSTGRAGGCQGGSVAVARVTGALP